MIPLLTTKGFQGGPGGGEKNKECLCSVDSLLQVDIYVHTLVCVEPSPVNMLESSALVTHKGTKGERCQCL
jgi:hypothetical protein